MLKFCPGPLFPLFLLCCIVSVVLGVTDADDLEVLNQLRKGLENPELLQWPENGNDPCGPPTWKHVYCSGPRVAQIQVQGLGLKGSLPQSLNKLEMLSNVGLQRNLFTGKLPSFSGLSNLQYAYLDYNSFDSIPIDFFDGLTSLEVLALDENDFNRTTGWSIPDSLQQSAQLTNFSCMNCNLEGPLPAFLGNLSSLTNLRLSGNSLSGEIPASYAGLGLSSLWLNDQRGGGLSGPIDVVTTMESLEVLWLHGNSFTGGIPNSIGNLTLLKDLNLNGNKLVGLLPEGLVNLPLDKIDLNNNQFMGPIPEFKAKNVTYSSNAFCQPKVGVPCASQVTELIEFLAELNYPSHLVRNWAGNDPCQAPWLGLRCNVDGKVDLINLPKFNLSGTLGPSIAKLDALTQIKLQSNNLTGPIPQNWTNLRFLKMLDLSDNNIAPPLPKFSNQMKLDIGGNPLLKGNQSAPAPSAANGSAGSGDSLPKSSASGSNPPKMSRPDPTRVPGASSLGQGGSTDNKRSRGLSFIAVVAPVASVVAIALIAIPFSIYCCMKIKASDPTPCALVVHPKDPSDSDDTLKIVVANNANGSPLRLTGSGYASGNRSNLGDSHVIETGNLVISFQVLQNVTKNFAPENELGRGGFGVVYKGELEDGSKIAVKRMEAGVISNKALDEFQSEIRVLSKVRHRHLVSLIGYSIQGNERTLVYEYMPQGALSKHLFHWKTLNLEPLSWKRRLNIALDVARGLEYLHSLAHRSFIHRDLKSSNILIGDDFRAKISDFGLVKLAPDVEKSVVTRLAGTFGYLAPEYAVTGKITTKVDVFSYGVVLMELLTGMTALDEDRPEESQYLASWFWHIKADKLKLRAAVDPTLDVNDETFESICVMAELAGHCTARESGQRPDMGHVVNMLSPLVDMWKPLDDDIEEYSGIDYSLPLNQMVKGWQEVEGKDFSYMDLEDSKGSIPARPTGFADSFTSSDGR